MSLNVVIVIAGVVFALLVLGLVIARTVTAKVKSGGWNEAVAQLAHEFGMQHLPIPSHFDQATGVVGGRNVTVSVDMGDDMSHHMKIVVNIEAGWALMIKARKDPALFFEGSAGQPTPLGAPSFDNEVDLRGASPQLFEALHNQVALRQAVVQCVQAGAVVTAGEIQLKANAIPTTLTGIRGYLDALLDLARRLDDPAGAHVQPVTGTASSARVGHITNIPYEQRLPHYQAFVAEVAAQIGPGQAFAKPNDNEVEWRGSYQSVPIRIVLDGCPNVEIHAKVNNPHGDINLEWDKAKVEQQMPADVWSQNDTAYLFVGKGVFFEGSQYDVDMMAARFRSLPIQATDAVVQVMTAEKIRYFRIWADTIVVTFGPDLNEMLDPEGQIVRTAQLLGWLVQMLQATAPDPQLAQVATMGWGAVQLLHKITCRYCNTLFLLQADRYECPNCGAPAQG